MAVESTLGSVLSQWPLRTTALEAFPISSWIKSILNPPKFRAIPRKEARCFQLFAIIVMDIIWFSRNQVVHNSHKLQIPSS